jgi:hypothetical protein
LLNGLKNSVARKKMSCLDIEIAVSEFFGIRKNIIVPNVQSGMSVHECDLFVLTKAGYAYEVEIKVSPYDLKHDGEKKHGHLSNRIKGLYFAIPDYLEPYQEYVPERAGIISVSFQNRRGVMNYNEFVCKEIRPAVIQKSIRHDENERFQLARLGAMRIWALKRKLRKYLNPS